MYRRSLFQLLHRWPKLNLRSIQTSGKKSGGGGGHGHQAESKKPSGLWAEILYPENQLHERRGWLYREYGNLQGAKNATVARLALTCVWWYIFYNLFKHPENVWGHMEYPDTSKWTDQELGIPPDDQE